MDQSKLIESLNDEFRFFERKVSKQSVLKYL